jgi:hypothetical protein
MSGVVALGVAGILGTLAAAFGVPTLQDRQQRKRASKIGRRLVAGELAEIGVNLASILDAQRMPSIAPDARFLPNESWEAHKGSLALDLPEAQWHDIWMVYSIAGTIRSLAMLNPGQPVSSDLLDESRNVASSAYEEALKLGFSKKLLGDQHLRLGGAKDGANAS